MLNFISKWLHKAETRRARNRSQGPLAQGQALVEYALLTALLVLAIIVALTATGPAIGNVFSNTVFNLIGAPAPSVTPLNPTQFWDLVTAVASYTPNAVVLATNTMAPPTSTPTVGPTSTATPITPTGTATSTNTPAPSETPVDIVHNAPFYDTITNGNWWRLDQDSVYAGSNAWSVQWWTTSSSTRTLTHVNARMAETPTCTSTYDYSQGADLTFAWGSGGPTPGGTCSGSPWRTDDFASRWTRVVRFASSTTLKLTTAGDDGIRVYVDGALVSAISSWNYQSAVIRQTNYTFTGGVDHTVVVEYFEGSGDATLGFSMRAASDDVGTCSWTMSSEFAHSSPSAWSDSPGRDYLNSTKCHLALRGGVNLATLTNPARMSFWNRWDLDNYDKAWLQIREYGDTGPWYAQLIHQNYQEQLAWMRQDVDLANYTSINTATSAAATINWTGKTIEFRFVLETDSTETENGWWIDDISIEANVIKTYTIGFADNMEGGDGNWTPSGTWAISTEKARSGSAWSDSPGVNYANSSDTFLTLNGMVDLTVPESTQPELVFYHSWYLAATDLIKVEVSLDGTSWVSLTEDRAYDAVQAATRNDAFVRESLSLQAYDGKLFYLRFRLTADASSNAGGWWIDDIAIQNRPSGNMPYPFFDDMESGGSNWLADGSWAISPEAAFSGSSAWSDSPGAYYVHNTNSSIQTSRPFLLTTSIATRPELSFFHRRYLGKVDTLYVEVSTNNGASWTSVWSYQYTASTSAPSYAPGVQALEFNWQMGWERVSINLSSYISDTVPFLLRFRLDALTDSETREGVWIDDVRLAEYTETPISLPFNDDMEGTTNWRAGGQWTLSTESVHSGTYAWSDSPGSDYLNNSWSVLELINPVDLTTLSTSSFPVLYWWDRYSLDKYDYARVQVSTWLGSSWSNWSNWTEVNQAYYTATLSWDRNQVDLRPYIGKKIRIRFVLDAMTNDNTDPGWWIDDVSIRLYQPQVFSGSFYDGAENLTNWITEGTWGLGQLYRGSGSGPAVLGPGLWQAQFYDLEQWACNDAVTRATKAISGQTMYCSGAYRTFTIQRTSSMANVNFNCTSLNSPNPDGSCNAISWKSNGSHDLMAIRFTRTINVEAGQYQFRLNHDDGIRLYIDGSQVLSRWSDGAYTDTTSRYLSAGAHTLEIWYYENGGAAIVQLDVSRQSFSFHDSPDGDYKHLDNMSLILDGVVDMTGSTNPSLSWYETYDMDNYDCMIVELSLPFETGRFNQWIQIYNRCSEYNATWTLRNISLRAPIETALGLASGTFNFNNKLLTFRFRLDARSNTATDPGWYIDDVLLAD